MVGEKYSFNPTGFDPDGDSLSYQLIIPKVNSDKIIDGYQFPDSPQFYSNFEIASLDGNPAILTIDSINGHLIWDLPADIFNSKAENESNDFEIAIRVLEWRNINNTWFQMGYIVRDMLISVIDQFNKRVILNSHDFHEISIYPNPFQSNFVIESYETFQYTIYDFSGKKIDTSHQIIEGKHQFGDSLEPGVYFLNIRTNNGLSQTSKIIKSN